MTKAEQIAERFESSFFDERGNDLFTFAKKKSGLMWEPLPGVVQFDFSDGSVIVLSHNIDLATNANEFVK